jgi:hypothetical protein
MVLACALIAMGPLTRRDSPAARGDAEPASLLVASDGAVVGANATATKLLGRPEAALRSLRLQDLVADDDAKVAALLGDPGGESAAECVLLSSLVLLPLQGPALRCIVRVSAEGAASAGGRLVEVFVTAAQGPHAR